METFTQAPQLITGAGGTVAAGAGLWAWMGENATQLTVIFGAIGATCAVAGFVYTVWRDRR